jgi:hypothetical protein
MADEADMTADRAEREAPYLLRAALKPAGPKAVGYCLFCGEPFAKDSLERFCDSGCRDDFEYRSARRIASGATDAY